MSKSLNEIAREAHATAIQHGWWNEPVKSIGEQLVMMHSEISEALEEYRAGHAPETVYYGEDGKPEGFGVELADVVIRILDTMMRYGIDPEAIIQEKMAFNQTRSYRHGNKRL